MVLYIVFCSLKYICQVFFLRSFFFHPSTQEIANFAAHIFESSSWGLYQTLPLYLQLWDIFITFSLCSDMTRSRTCLSLTSTLTAWSFTLRHSPTTLFSKNTPFSRTFQRPVYPLGFHIFYSTKKLSRARLASSPGVFLDVGKLRRMIIWSGSAVGGPEWVLSFVLNGGFIWVVAEPGMVKRSSKHFLIPLRERKREALVCVEKDHQVWHLFF